MNFTPEIREEIFESLREGKVAREIGEHYGVSRGSIKEAIGRFRKQGFDVPTISRGRRKGDFDDVEPRLWGQVDKETNGGCWAWTGYTMPEGYGKIGYRGSKALVHRLSYELLVGPIPDGLHIDHLCRNRCCVNPAHLEPVTPRVNSLRGIGPTAINAAKTHCKRGHELAGDNLYVRPNGMRLCRACNQKWHPPVSKTGNR